MEDASDTGEDNILTLPWNRLPNYLICVVALVNLVAGIITVRIAIDFGRDISSFDRLVATLFTGLFGLLFIWVAWCFRTGVLPVRFVADAERRECGFRWLRWWNGRFDLSSTERLIGEVRRYRGKWLWAILAAKPDPGGEEQWIYGSKARFDSQADAESECQSVTGQLAEHFSLPSELRTQTRSPAPA